MKAAKAHSRSLLAIVRHGPTIVVDAAGILNEDLEAGMRLGIADEQADVAEGGHRVVGA